MNLIDMFFKEYSQKDVNDYADEIDKLFILDESKLMFLQIIEGEAQARTSEGDRESERRFLELVEERLRAKALEKGQSSPQRNNPQRNSRTGEKTMSEQEEAMNDLLTTIAGVIISIVVIAAAYVPFLLGFWWVSILVVFTACLAVRYQDQLDQKKWDKMMVDMIKKQRERE